MNEFEPVRLDLLINHPRGIASNYDDFVQMVLTSIQHALNSEAGQALIDPLLADAIRSGISPAEWQQKKVDIMKILFFMVIDQVPPLKHELAHHLYNELRKEPKS